MPTNQSSRFRWAQANGQWNKIISQENRWQHVCMWRQSWCSKKIRLQRETSLLRWYRNGVLFWISRHGYRGRDLLRMRGKVEKAIYSQMFPTPAFPTCGMERCKKFHAKLFIQKRARKVDSKAKEENRLRKRQRTLQPRQEAAHNADGMDLDMDG